MYLRGKTDKETRIPPKPDLSTTDVDFKGVVYGTQLAIHFMRKNTTPGGKIVATASAAAIVPHETYPEYDGAKAAVVNFVRATARILKNVGSCGVMGTVDKCSLAAEGKYQHQHCLPRHRPHTNHPTRNDRCRVARLVGSQTVCIGPSGLMDNASLTPVSTVVAAYERCLDDASVFGKVIECSAGEQLDLEPPTLANGHYSRRAVTVWEPLFKL